MSSDVIDKLFLVGMATLFWGWPGESGRRNGGGSGVMATANTASLVSLLSAYFGALHAASRDYWHAERQLRIAGQKFAELFSLWASTVEASQSEKGASGARKA
jgi:hypothetical protein